jgi:hypothetical protein
MERVFERIMLKAADMEKAADANKEQVKEKLKEKAGDEAAEQAENEADEETGLKKAREERAVKEITKAENALKEAKQKLQESGASEEDILAAEQVLEQVKAAKQNGDAKEARKMAEKVKEFGNEVSAIAQKLGESRSTGDFEQMKEQLRQAIRARYQEHMNDLVERAPEQVQEQIRQRVEEHVQKMEDRFNRTPSSAGIGGRNSTRPVDKGNGTKGSEDNSTKPVDKTNSTKGSEDNSTKPVDNGKKDINSTDESKGKIVDSENSGSQ